jgi:uncharacterized protein (DUF697 family)
MADRIASAPTPPVPWFQRVTFYSVMAGLCPLIPVPFLDDRVLDAVKRRMTTVLARERGVGLTERQRDYLSGTYSESKGCLARTGGLAFKLTVKLVGKIFRKLLIFLAAKEAADVASRTFHEGYLLHLLFDPATPPAWPDPERAGTAEKETDAWHARWAIERAVAETDPRPVNQAMKRTFRSSRGLMKESARVLGKAVRAGKGPGVAREETAAAVEAEESERLAGVVEPLADELWIERGYLDDLESRFRQWHRTAETTSPPGTEPVAADREA